MPPRRTHGNPPVAARSPSFAHRANLRRSTSLVKGLVGSRSPLWRTGRQASTRHATSDARGDPLHAIYGIPWRTPLLRAFAAGQDQSTTTRWAPLLSLAVPSFMPQTCPKGAAGL